MQLWHIVSKLICRFAKDPVTIRAQMTSFAKARPVALLVLSDSQQIERTQGHVTCESLELTELIVV